MALSEAQCSAYAGNENDILKIISNLPTGWKVVGLTELNQTKGAPFMPRFLPQSIEVKGNESSNATTASDGDASQSFTNKSNNVHDPQLTADKMNSSHVSKDSLNASSSKTSSLASVFKPESKDESVPLCLDKKKLHSHSGVNVSNSGDFNASLGTNHCPSNVRNEENILVSQQTGPQSSQSSENKVQQAIPQSTQDILLPFRSDSKWTVVGITPLPQLQDTTETEAAELGTSSSNTSLLLSTHEDKTNSGQQQNQTILKIPHCGFHNASQPAPFNQNPTLSNIFQPSPEAMRWTVVGFTNSVSSTTSTSPLLITSQNSLSTTNSSLVSETKLPPLKVEESGFANSHSLSPVPHAKMNGQSNSVSQSVVSLNGSSPMLSAFPGFSSIVNPEIQSQVPSEWRVVGISPIVNTANPLPSLPPHQADQLLQQPTSSLASTSCLKISSTTFTTTSTSVVQPQFPALASSSVIEVNRTDRKQSTPTRSPIWQGHEKNFTINPDVLPLTMSSAVSGSHKKYDAKSCHPFLSNVCQTKLSTMLHAKMNNTDLLPVKDAQSNEWKVVGVVANNQVSMLPPETTQEAKSPVKDSEHLVPVPIPSLYNSRDLLNAPKNEDIINMRIPQSCDKIYHHVAVGRKEYIDESAVALQPPLNLEARIDKRKQEIDWNRRAKDMLKKSNTSKLKKNTVSSLLKLKRYHVNEPEHPDVSRSQDFYEEDVERFTDDIPRKRCRSRSLRSYSGNRQQFQHSQDRYESVYPVKSISDTAFSDPNSEEESERSQVIKVEKLSPPASPVNTPERNNEEVSNHSFSQSPARRRKLKVPRKMVADLDYHPFDSSSDSN